MFVQRVAVQLAIADVLSKTSQHNDQAPEPPDVAIPQLPGEFRFCRLPTASPLGVPAGPLLNGNSSRNSGCGRRCEGDCSKSWPFRYATHSGLPNAVRFMWAVISTANHAMKFKLKCPDCAAMHTITDSMRGKRARCSQCEKVFVVPTVDSADQAPPRSTSRNKPSTERLSRNGDLGWLRSMEVIALGVSFVLLPIIGVSLRLGGIADTAAAASVVSIAAALIWGCMLRLYDRNYNTNPLRHKGSGVTGLVRYIANYRGPWTFYLWAIAYPLAMTAVVIALAQIENG